MPSRNKRRMRLAAILGGVAALVAAGTPRFRASAGEYDDAELDLEGNLDLEGLPDFLTGESLPDALRANRILAFVASPATTGAHLAVDDLLARDCAKDWPVFVCGEYVFRGGLSWLVCREGYVFDRIAFWFNPSSADFVAAAGGNVWDGSTGWSDPESLVDHDEQAAKGPPAIERWLEAAVGREWRVTVADTTYVVRAIPGNAIDRDPVLSKGWKRSPLPSYACLVERVRNTDVTRLLHQVEHDEPQKRAEALLDLAALDRAYDDFLGYFIHFVGDQDPFVSGAAVAALLKFWPATARELALLLDHPTGSQEVLAALTAQPDICLAIPGIAEVYRRGGDATKEQAINLLWQFGEGIGEAEEMLRDAAKSERIPLRRLAESLLVLPRPHSESHSF